MPEESEQLLKARPSAQSPICPINDAQNPVHLRTSFRSCSGHLRPHVFQADTAVGAGRDSANWNIEIEGMRQAPRVLGQSVDLHRIGLPIRASAVFALRKIEGRLIVDITVVPSRPNCQTYA
jgi:hypothetical protein